MIIKTKYHGQKEINPDSIITFESGIPSFEEENKFILLEIDESIPFLVLQSTTTPSVAFLVINPFEYFPDYEFSLSDQVLETLKIGQKEDVITFSILTIREPFEQTTANLKGPIVINSKEKLGKQLVISEEKYSTRHILFQKPSNGEENK